MELRNENILITGGGSGIGAAIAKRFTDAGALLSIDRNMKCLYSMHNIF